MLLAIPYPLIDPVLIDIGPLPIRWYALSYIGALVFGWAYARAIVGDARLWNGVPRPSVASMDDLMVYFAIGIIAGGRIGYVLFYNLDFFRANPLEIPAVWHGGMSFHGGLTGAAVAMFVFARRNAVPLFSVSDACSAVVPIGIFLVRLANFIKPELWGRPTDVPWAMVFPGAGPFPRHPSQLYEAGLEGLALGVILVFVIRSGGLQRPGLTTGVFVAGYGLARITCEFFREPDPQLGFLFGGATMGMVLSLPLVALGLVLILRARRRALVPA